MGNTLVATTELAGLPGAPFSQDAVDQAAATIRAECGWHIAPAVTETLVVESSGDRLLFLPTARLTSITAVRDVTFPESPQIVTGWYPHQTAAFRSGIVAHRWCWPRWAMLEVDVVHGYDKCPPDLLPLIAQIAVEFGRNRAIRSESVGSVSLTYDPSAGGAMSALGQYKIPAV